MDQNIRNFKDFLQFYNRVSEACFSRCVDNFNTRLLEAEESGCVEGCASKFIQYNHRVMGGFVKAQTDILSRRMQDQAAQEAIVQDQSEEIAVEGS